MEDYETMVENDDFEADDTLEEEVIEDEDAPEQDIDSLVEEDATPAEEPKQKSSQGTGEPGWFKSRWEKEVSKLSAQIRDQIRGEYEAQIAPMRDRLLEMDAQELVRKGEVKDIETARELVRYRQNQPTPVKQEQPREADGRFAPKQDPQMQARIKILANQADKILEKTGIDVMEAFHNDPELRNKVFSGEMDFYEVAEKLKPSRRKPPAPMRTPNGSSIGPNSIEAMTDAQFKKLDKMLDEDGVRFTMKR